MLKKLAAGLPQAHAPASLTRIKCIRWAGWYLAAWGRAAWPASCRLPLACWGCMGTERAEQSAVAPAKGSNEF